MEPQLGLGAVKPDFVFYSSDQNIPRLAVFCDGWQFHASPVINRIADDATKRAALRDQGLVVLGLTWQDLIDAEANTPTPPPWFSETRWTQAMAATGGTLKPAHLDLVKGGPIDYLVRWISHPDPAGIEALAEALPLLLVGAGPHGKAEASGGLVDLTKTIHDGGTLAVDGDRLAWGWQHDTLTVLARNVAAQGYSTEIAALLDDRDSRLGQSHKGAWREWIRLANLLNLRLQPAHITAYSYALAAPANTTPDGVELAEPWASLYQSAVSDAEKKLIALLAASGAPAPSLGYETGNGLPIDISWPEYHVAVDIDFAAEDRDELSQDGWTLVDAELEDILSTLAKVGAS